MKTFASFLPSNDTVGDARSAAFTPLHSPHNPPLSNATRSSTLKRRKRRAPLASIAPAFFIAFFLASSLDTNAAVYVTGDRLWTNGIVPFKWHAEIPFSNRLRVVAAMNIWTAVANITFVLGTNETDYVLIQNAAGENGSSSPTIGRGGNEQDLFIRQDLSGVTDFGLAHELGHVLGFYHTHQCPDRNTFVTWFSNRTDVTKWGNFTIASTALAYPRNSMDYDSVMSYGRCTFSICDDCGDNLATCRVLQINDPDALAEFDTAMGQRSYLTTNDARVMSFIYPQPNWRFVEAGYGVSSENGRFHNPYLTASKALTNVPNNTVLWVQPGSYQTGIGVISKPLVLRGPLGHVVIRRN